MSKNQGYLVVLDIPYEALYSDNWSYKGIDRLPPHQLPPLPLEIEMEAEGLDEYAFGNYTNEQGFIPDLESARKLLSLFAKSPRKFKIIYCRESQAEAKLLSPVQGGRFLGFDVAGDESPFWSIVVNFPSEPKAKNFLSRLNKNGLFESFKDANKYLDFYRFNKLPDHDLPLKIWEVYDVLE